MTTIYKWPLHHSDVQILPVPEGTTFLHVAEQNGLLMIWGLCDSDNMLEDRVLAVVGTGNPAPREDEARYIGTALMHTGLVWHVFEPNREYDDA